MKLHIILLIAAVSNVHTISPDKTQLGVLIDDLSILARVTNAIALQIEASEKSVKLDDLIFQILQVDGEKFNYVMNTDILAIRAYITEVQKKCSDFVNTKRYSREKLNVASDHLPHLLVILENLESTSSAYSNNKISSQQFLDQVSNRAEVDSLIICEEDVLDVATEFYNQETGAVSRVERKHLSNLEELRSNTEKLKKCLENFENYNSTVEQSSLVRSYRKLENVFELSKVYNTFATHYNWFVQIGADLDTLGNMYYKTKNIWMTKYNNESQMIRTMDTKFKDIKLTDNHNSSGLTAGFDSSDDLVKVFEDVKSEWFQNNIVKGKSTKELDESLGFYSKFADVIKELGESWRSVLADFPYDTNLLKMKADTLTRMETFKSGDKDSFTPEKIAKFKKCLELSKELKGTDLFETFDNAYEKPLEMHNYLKNIINETVKMRDEGSLRGLPHALEELKVSMSKNQSFSKDAIGFKQVQRQNVFWDQLISGLRQISDIGHFQKEYLRAARSIKIDINPFDVAKLIQPSKLLEALQCLKSDTNGTEIFETVDFVLQITSFHNEPEFRKVKEVLEQIEKVQEELRRLKVMVKEYTSTSTKKIDFPSAKDLSASFGRGVEALREMEKVGRSRDLFTDIRKFHDKSILSLIVASPGNIKSMWSDPYGTFHSIVKGLDDMEQLAKSLNYQNGSFLELKSIFDRAKTVHGVPVDRKTLLTIAEKLKFKRNSLEDKVITQLSELHLDFVSHDLDGAGASLIALKSNFDEMFGHRERHLQVVHDEMAYVTIAIVFVLVVVFLLIVSCAIYVCTPSGKVKFVSTCIYYFGKTEDFEKRWRYSLFLDRQDGKNALVDAVREVNATHVQKRLRKGAYVDVYNLYGNTSLHTATKLGHPEIVKLLIKNGADRHLLNSQNKIPEQMIPKRSRRADKAARYEKIEKIYEKYRNTTFRVNVPELFPVTSFHIYLEDRTDNKMTNAFMEKFQSITSDEPLPTTTHCVVKTEEGGVLETDQLSLLVWIFNGVIIVNESWMSDCLKDERLISQDYKYLVEKVRFKGILYEDVVLPWSRAMAKGSMPFLHGVYVAVVMKEYSNLLTLASLVHAQGGIMLNEFPQKENYNKGSHPYLHSNLGPLFIIHDGQINLDTYKDDEMYTLFTEEQFIIFMLKRVTHPVATVDPISVLVVSEFKEK